MNHQNEGHIDRLREKQCIGGWRGGGWEGWGRGGGAAAAAKEGQNCKRSCAHKVVTYYKH